MLAIRLNNLQFHSFHGVHEEERVLGNMYEVNVELGTSADLKVVELEDTYNYEKAYYLIKERMNIPTPLLEVVAREIAELLYAANERFNIVSVSIEKKFPPLATMQGSASVIYKKEYQ
jgi:dihydroneopterin aldolase